MTKKFHPLGAYQKSIKVYFWPISKNAKQILSSENLMYRNEHNDYIYSCVQFVVNSYMGSSHKENELNNECIQCVDAILAERAIWDCYGFEFQYGDLKKATKLATTFNEKTTNHQTEITK